jgi:signal transduction histidine kinase
MERMQEMLFSYYLTRFEVLVILFSAGLVGCILYWVLRKRWRNTLETLQQELGRVRDKVEAANKLNAFRHSDLLPGLTFISKKAVETLSGLPKDQIALRDKQNLIVSKARDLFESARNALDISELERHGTPKGKELLNVKGLVEDILREYHHYADSKGVTLLTNLTDVEPTLLNRELTLHSLRPVIHNAIKYSNPGGVVEIVLGLEGDDKDGDEK